MPENKRQHYVPQFYLKNFSFCKNSRSISVYLIDHNKIVKKASLREQCSRGYFYGKDLDIERGLSDLEGMFSRTFRKVISTPEELDVDDLDSLRSFVVLQYLRTEAAAKRFNFGMAEMLRGMPGIEEFLKDTSQAHVSQFISVLPSVSDLKVKVVRVDCEGSFFASDDPVCVFNKLEAQRKYQYGFYSCGVGSAGILIWCPISPKHGVLVYDNDVYKIGGNESLFSLKECKDVEALNLIQLQTANKVLFVLPNSDLQYLSKLRNKVENIRLKPRVVVNHAVKVEGETEGGQSFRVVEFEEIELMAEENDGLETLVHSETRIYKPISWPKFIRNRLKPTFIDTNSGAGLKRTGQNKYHIGKSQVWNRF